MGRLSSASDRSGKEVLVRKLKTGENHNSSNMHQQTMCSAPKLRWARKGQTQLGHGHLGTMREKGRRNVNIESAGFGFFLNFCWLGCKSVSNRSDENEDDGERGGRIMGGAKGLSTEDA